MLIIYYFYEKFFLMKKLIFSIILMSMCKINAQDKLPYYEIPEAPKEYTAATVASRMIDGLGFRYYWATEGLTEKDLEHQPSPSSRTAGLTIDHILGLSQVILNATLEKPNGDKYINYAEYILQFKF